jgi:nucleoside-diphosphate-sugar epimerase
MFDAVVLGAGGFLGSAIAARLIEEGASVRLVARRTPESPEARAIWDRAADRRVVDISARPIPMSGCRELYHFAADMGGVGYLSTDQARSYIANARMTLNVLESLLASDVQRAFFAGSACAYPVEIQQGPEAPLLHEGQLDVGTPDKLYGREKRSMIALAEQTDADVRVGVLHTVYGIGQKLFGPRTKFPPAVVMKALDARSTGRIEVWGDGSQKRSFLWVDDAVEKIFRMMAMPYAGPTNVGFQGAISVDDAVQVCADVLGIEPHVTHLPSQPTGPIARDCDNTLATERYGHHELVQYRDGFGRMLEWADWYRRSDR